MTKDELITIVNKLIALGEDAEELGFWLTVYDDLDEGNKRRIDKILNEELKELLEINQSKE